MSWEALRDVSNRTRNMIRRGYLLGTNTDNKLMRGRVRTGDGIENDNLDIVQPVGFASRLPSGPKVEVITADVNGDASKRVILAVIGDRATHPKPEEGESIQYAPGDPTKKMSVSKGKGVSIESGDQPIAMSTDKGLSMKAKEGADLFDTINIDAEGNVTIKGNLILEKNLTVKGSIQVDGNVVVTGTVTASGFIDT